MKRKKDPAHIHVISHGPYCLDGVACAVIITRFHPDSEVVPAFCGNTAVDRTLLALRCEPEDGEHAVWITDISWTDPRVDDHLERLRQRGVQLYWIDHHRTAMSRYENGKITATFTDLVLNDTHSAAFLTFEYLAARNPSAGAVTEMRKLAEMADDNDRWIHRIPGSRELALAVSALPVGDAYRELLDVGPAVRFTPALEAAYGRVRVELQGSLDLATKTRVEHALPGGGTLVCAVCNGYASEIADHWGKVTKRAVFAFFDVRGQRVSLRRSPDCTIDLSHLAEGLRGGGHPAAAGCELPDLHQSLAQATLQALLPFLETAS